jgi:hypothetical protein
VLHQVTNDDISDDGAAEEERLSPFVRRQESVQDVFAMLLSMPAWFVAKIGNTISRSCRSYNARCMIGERVPQSV